jgi:hypothetical protein
VHEDAIYVVGILINEPVRLLLRSLADLVHLRYHEGGGPCDADLMTTGSDASSAPTTINSLSKTAASSPQARRIARLSCGGTRAPRARLPPPPASASGTMRSTGMPSGLSHAPGWFFSGSG